MNPEKRAHTKPHDVKDRLAHFGLTMEPFVTAALKNYAAFAACTASHPPTYPGTAGWAEANRSLRDDLFKSDWSKKNETNLPLVLNDGKTMAITACSGDENTGIEDQTPCTRSPKGVRTKDAVSANQHAFEFMKDPAPIVASVHTPGRATWIFLIYRDPRRSEIRSELSLPGSMTEEGHIDSWKERIIFQPIPFDDARGLAETGGNDLSPEIAIEVKKRAGA